DGSVLLARAVFVYYEILSPDVRYEVTFRVLHEDLESHDSRDRVNMNLAALFPLNPLKQRRGWPVRDVNLPGRGGSMRRFRSRRRLRGCLRRANRQEQRERKCSRDEARAAPRQAGN